MAIKHSDQTLGRGSSWSVSLSAGPSALLLSDYPSARNRSTSAHLGHARSSVAFERRSTELSRVRRYENRKATCIQTALPNQISIRLCHRQMCIRRLEPATL